MKKRDPEKTRKKILKSATKIFAKKGFSGTSISAVVKESGYNERMIYHYFGDKAGLYRAVFVSQWNELKTWFDEASNERMASGQISTDVRVIIRQVVEIFFDYIASHPDLVRLFLWEGLEDGHITRSLWKEVSGPIYAQVEFLVKQAQADGKIGKEHEPQHLIVSLLGLIGYYFAFAHTLEDVFGKETLSKKSLEERKKQVMIFLEGLYL